MIVETILGGVILALLGGLIGKAISDIRVNKLEAELMQIRLTLARIEVTLADLPTMKSEIEALYERMREVEGNVKVVQNGCKLHHKGK